MFRSRYKIYRSRSVTWRNHKWSSIIIITLLLLVSLPYILNTTTEYTTSAASVITVTTSGDGDFKAIQAAVDHAKPGDTIKVLPGTYYENITINKTINLIGSGAENTIISGYWSEAVLDIRASWCNVSGLTITGSYCYSTVFMIGDHNTITDCYCFGNVIGIHLENANYNLIDNCTSQSNTGAGMYIGNSSYNTFNNSRSINSVYGFGVYLFFSFRNTFKNGACDQNADDGFYAYWLSNSNTIENYTFNDNLENGIYLLDSDDFIINNCISNRNGLNGFVIESSHNLITNCTSSSNIGNGFHLYHSEYSTVANGLSYNNSGIGFYLKYTLGNIITKNSVVSNLDFGIKVTPSSNSNRIYCNDFVNNNLGDDQALENGSKIEEDIIKKDNQWDSDGVGNYWWDYLYYYPNASSDGQVWDSPYSISEAKDSMDNFPLVEPYLGLEELELLQPGILNDSDSDGIFDALDAFPNDPDKYKKELRSLILGPVLSADKVTISDATVTITINSVVHSNKTDISGYATITFSEALAEGTYQAMAEKNGFENRQFVVTINDDRSYVQDVIILDEEHKEDKDIDPVALNAIMIVVIIIVIIITVFILAILIVLKKRKNHDP